MTNQEILGDLSLQEALSIALTALAIVVSVFLAVIGIWINSRQNREEKRLEELEKFVSEQKNNLFGIRFFSAILLHQNNNLYAHTDKLARFIIKLVKDKNQNYEKEEIERIISLIDLHNGAYLNEAKRISLYGDILTSTTSDLEARLTELRKRFPDMESLKFIEALSSLEQEAAHDICREEILKIKSQLGKLNSKAWTGIE